MTKNQLDAKVSTLLNLTILFTWCVSWVFGVGFADLGLNLFTMIWVIWMTWVTTGLFIVGHDAIHGVALVGRPNNDRLGRLVFLLFGGLSFRLLVKGHRDHHAFPGSDRDPDAPKAGGSQFVRWYLKFLREYFSPITVLWWVVVSQIVFHLLHRPISALWLGYGIPSLLASLQLFYFGTFVPHRRGAYRYSERHASGTSAAPKWVVFLQCFNFGCHWEHHEYPETPWWRLPERRSVP